MSIESHQNKTQAIVFSIHEYFHYANSLDLSKTRIMIKVLQREHENEIPKSINIAVRELDNRNKQTQIALSKKVHFCFRLL